MRPTFKQRLMRPRDDVLTIFSTFIQFADDRFAAWVKVPRLLQSMQQQFERSGKSLASVSKGEPGDLSKGEPGESTVNFWVLYWLRLWQSEHPRAEAHLKKAEAT